MRFKPNDRLIISRQPKRRGFLLLEALIATALFAISITAIIFAVQSAAFQSHSIARERWAQKQLKNVLTEAIKSTRTEEEFKQGLNITLPEFGAQGIVNVTPAELTNEEGDVLDNLYNLKVTIVWYDDNEKREKTIETLQYYPLFQPSR